MSPELKIPKFSMFGHEKLLWDHFFRKKLLQIRRDLVESYSRHILKISSSNSDIQNFSSKVSDKSEKSMRIMEIIDFLPQNPLISVQSESNSETICSTFLFYGDNIVDAVGIFVVFWGLWDVFLSNCRSQIFFFEFSFIFPVFWKICSLRQNVLLTLEK